MGARDNEGNTPLHEASSEWHLGGGESSLGSRGRCGSKE